MVFQPTIRTQKLLFAFVGMYITLYAAGVDYIKILCITLTEEGKDMANQRFFYAKRDTYCMMCMMMYHKILCVWKEFF